MENAQLAVLNRKRVLQEQIDAGSIDSSEALEEYLWRRGWHARATDRVSKRNRAILIVKPGVDKNFQIEVGFAISKPELEQPGIWIYALIARSGTEKACYIGQSKSVMRRFAEHAKRSRSGRGSAAFFDWADLRGASVHAILLEFSEPQDGKGRTAKRATYLEGTWLREAVKAGYQTPGVEKWGRLPALSKDSACWNDDEIKAVAKSFNEIIKHSLWLSEFCWKPPAFLIEAM